MSRSSFLITSILSAFAALAVGCFAGQSTLLVGGYSSVCAFAVIALVVQWVAYVPAAQQENEKFYDLVGAGTYALIVILALWIAYGADRLDTRRIVVGACVLIWAFRLGGYLFSRVHQVGKDGRFDHIKVDPLHFLMVWTLQGLWVLLTLLPVMILITIERAGPPLGWVDFVGWGIWGMGFSIEIIADRQKAKFREGNTEGKWIDEGLWSRCQHPNYFGEITLWSGLFVSGLHSYEGYEWLAVLSPIFVYVLLTRMSGVPMLQERGDARWGDDPAYRAYRENTPLLLPLGKRAP